MYTALMDEYLKTYLLFIRWPYSFQWKSIECLKHNHVINVVICLMETCSYFSINQLYNGTLCKHNNGSYKHNWEPHVENRNSKLTEILGISEGCHRLYTWTCKTLSQQEKISNSLNLIRLIIKLVNTNKEFTYQR